MVRLEITGGMRQHLMAFSGRGGGGLVWTSALGMGSGEASERGGWRGTEAYRLMGDHVMVEALSQSVLLVSRWMAGVSQRVRGVVDRRVGGSEWKWRSAPAGGQVARAHGNKHASAASVTGAGGVVRATGAVKRWWWLDGRRSRSGGKAGAVAVRTRVVAGRSQCTTSRGPAADWRG